MNEFPKTTTVTMITLKIYRPHNSDIELEGKLAGNNKTILEEIQQIRQENKEMKEKLEVWVQHITKHKLPKNNNFPPI